MENNPNIVAIIQARMGSTRLPGKVMKIVDGMPILWHVVSRLKRSKLLNGIVVATSTDKADNQIEDFCKKNNISFYRGSNEDVLSRYYQTAKAYKADLVVRITSDCPLIDPEIVDLVIKRHLDTKSDYTNNLLYPRGLSPEVFNYAALEKAYKEAKAQPEREHVTVYFYRNPSLFKVISVEAEKKFRRPDIRICVDQQEDVDLIRRIFEEMKGKDFFLTEEIIDLFNKKPELLKINSMVVQKGV
jgi:spore coat polysaccharide biosynthesis protein SpsF